MTTQESNNGTIYFWREFEVPYGFLSQWYQTPFHNPYEPSIIFSSAEQYMMYSKAQLFGDSEIASKIMGTKEPRKQKSLGRKVKGFNNKIWEENRERIVEEGNWWKFTCPVRRQGGGRGKDDDVDDLKKKLLETGQRELVEASPFDRIWGVGFGHVDAKAHRKEWGLNLLGKALMRVRERIRQEEEKDEKKGGG